MASISIHKPYDTFFRQAFEEPQAARELALNVAPREYEALLSRGRITVEKDRLVDEALRTHLTDLLIRVEEAADALGAQDAAPRAGGGRGRAGTRKAASHPPPARSLLIYILVEHKSYPDRWVTLQMLRYLVLIWQRERRKNPEAAHLPRVLALVLYHGARRWVPPSLTELVDATGPEDPHAPQFAPLFVNLADLKPEQLRGSIRTIMALTLLKVIKQRLTAAIGTMLLDLLQQASEDPHARQIAALCYQVLLRVKEREEIEYLQTLTRKPEYHGVQETVMTYAEELLQEGLEKGLEQGLEQGINQGELIMQRAVLVRQLERKFGLSEAERTRIEACEDRGALDAALDVFALATSKAAVLTKLP